MSGNASPRSVPSGAPELIYGCMGLGGSWDRQSIGTQDLKRAQAALEAALESGIRIFDHADIYAHGKSEQVFGRILKRSPELRRQILVQSKCGIRLADADQVKTYDLSSEHIVASVEGSLRRLNLESLDLLLLHRPDPLAEPEQIAAAWQTLHQAGKVRRLGVSNMHADQLRWLCAALDQRLAANQLEMSLGRRDWLESGTCFNDPQGDSALPWTGTLEYCQQQGITLQAWGALAQGRYCSSVPQDPGDRPTFDLVARMAAEYAVSREGMVLAWLMRHPARIQPLIGSLQPDRIRACAQSRQINLDRQHWYQLYLTARGSPLP